MNIPERLGWPNFDKEQKDIVRMWVKLGLDVEVKGMNYEGGWVSIKEGDLTAHFWKHQTGICWCFRLKP